MHLSLQLPNKKCSHIIKVTTGYSPVIFPSSISWLLLVCVDRSPRHYLPSTCIPFSWLSTNSIKTLSKFIILMNSVLYIYFKWQCGSVKPPSSGDAAFLRMRKTQFIKPMWMRGLPAYSRRFLPPNRHREASPVLIRVSQQRYSQRLPTQSQFSSPLFDWHHLTGALLPLSALLHISIITMYSEQRRVSVDECQSSQKLEKGNAAKARSFPGSSAK